MKQGEAARTSLDLDDLERQLAAAASPRRNGSDDPLAELARIVGYNDRPAPRVSTKGAGSFDDFLVNPPRSVSDMMGTQTNRGNAIPPVAPLLESGSASATRLPEMSPLAATPASETSPASLQDQLAAALGEFEPRLRPTLPIEEPAPPAPPAVAEPQVAAYAAAEPQTATAEPAPQPQVPEPPAATTTHSDPRFEEMLKEFDAAMRDVGARPLQAAPSEQGAPDTYTGPTVSPALAYDPDAEAAAMAPIQPKRSRFGMALAGGAIGVALIGAAGLLTFGGSSKNASNGAAPVIAAKPGVTKERPTNPGGVEVPNQDKEILSRGPSAPQAERVAPREEQPVDLTQAQRTADAPSGVRQIPGVLVVGPSTTQPAGSQSASATPPAAQPRPVASVPIVISGQPPVDTPTSPAPTAAPTQPSIPAAPSMTRPTAALPTQPAAPVATAPTPTAPPAVTAPTQPQAASGAQNASSEPRRVRAVPIRPDEGAPNRAQAQPRVVPAQPARPTAAAAAPAATDADDGNAPLRITPQANRGAANSSRAAALAPATVPGSTSAPTTTQSTSTETAPTGGGSFAVQIAAEGSQDAAQAKFNRMRSQHSGVLGSVSPTIRSAEVNGRAVYRVRVGQMSREEAVSLCERLKADGGSCFVARN